MAADIVALLANSLAKTAVEEKELSYKGQGRKLDDAKSGKSHLFLSIASISESVSPNQLRFVTKHTNEFALTKRILATRFSCVSMFSIYLFPVEEIVKEIQEFEGLQALRLEGNTIGVEAAQAIAKALETKSEFKVPSFTF